jgi:virginiamycin B lyase
VAVCLTGVAAFGSYAVAHAAEPTAATAIFTPIALEAPSQNVAVDGAGNAWFTLPSVNKLARVAPNGQVTYFAASAGGPYDVAVGGNIVWFTLLTGNQIGKLDTATGIFTYYTIPTANSEPTGISIGGGYIWFVERNGDKLGRLNPANGSIQEFYNWVVDSRNPVNMTDADLEDVAWSTDGVWITGPKFKNSIAIYRESENRFIPSAAGPGAEPMQLVVDSTGNAWVTFRGFGKIGRSAINTLGQWDFYDLPVGQSGPVGLFVRDANGRRELWYTRPGSNRIGYLLAGFNGSRLGVWETESPVAASAPWGIAVNAAGNAWVASLNANTALIWNSPYLASFGYLPYIRRIVETN